MKLIKETIEKEILFNNQGFFISKITLVYKWNKREEISIFKLFDTESTKYNLDGEPYIPYDFIIKGDIVTFSIIAL